MKELEPIQFRGYGSSGPAVVVLHGGPGAPGSAAGLARRLGRDFIVVEPLQRRSGRVQLTVARHVEDLAEIAPNPAVLIGHSWGAMLGLSYAARFPEKVSSLVLIGCGTYDASSRLLLRLSLERRLGEAGALQLRNLQERCSSEESAAVRDALLGEIGTAVMCAESYELIDEQEPEMIMPADAAGNLETWGDVLRLQREGVEPDVFEAITARVLMIHGDVDPHPGAETRDLLRRFIPQLEYLELERCGHEPWRERHAREPFLSVLRHWILG